jgi:hypothetical protein
MCVIRCLDAICSSHRRAIAARRMSFATKVAALRRFLGVPENLEMKQAIIAMNAMMGVVGEGALPAQVDALPVHVRTTPPRPAFSRTPSPS